MKPYRKYNLYRPVKILIIMYILVSGTAFGSSHSDPDNLRIEQTDIMLADMSRTQRLPTDPVTGDAGARYYKALQTPRITFFVAGILSALLLLMAFFAVFTAIRLLRPSTLTQTDTQLLQIRTALDNATDAIAITDHTGKFIYANTVFFDLFCYSADQIINGDLNSISVDRQAFVDMYRDALRLIPSEGEGDLISRDGRRFPAHLRCSPIIDNADRLAGILILVSDITERKESQRALAKLQSRMVQREKLASIGQLAAGVAHEMNTPVGFVSSNFKTLESYISKIGELLLLYDDLAGRVETSADTALCQVVTAIRDAREEQKIDFVLQDLPGLFAESAEGLDRVTSIVQNLRDFSRVDTSDVCNEYNINDGLAATLVVTRNELRFVAEVETDFAELPCVPCHSGRINQVFLNILVNAAQALKGQKREHKGAIAIRTYAEPDHVVCEISDDGPGMSDDTIARIFDPFFTTKPVGVGTGLGLAISYDIVVNKHGGELLVSSRLGKGTTFTVKLPRQRVESCRHAAEEHEESLVGAWEQI